MGKSPRAECRRRSLLRSSTQTLDEMIRGRLAGGRTPDPSEYPPPPGPIPRVISKMNSGCVHCPHFASRTEPYMGRTGPDSGCFRGSPVFTGAGMQFESHLGHKRSPRHPSDARFAGSGLAAAMAYSGVRVAGSGPWLVGPPPAVSWCYAVPRSGFCRVGRGWPTPVHGSGLPVQHDVAGFGAKFFLKGPS